MPEFYGGLLQLRRRRGKDRRRGVAVSAMRSGRRHPGLADACTVEDARTDWPVYSTEAGRSSNDAGTKDAPILEFENVAAQFPVFRVETDD